MADNETPTPAPVPPPACSGPAEAGPLLTAHTALVLLAAVVAGIIAGVLAYLGGGPPAAAVLAGLMAFGASAAALHKLIA